MKIRKNSFNGIILGMIIGIVITSGIGVTAITLNANQVTFTPNDSSFGVTNTKAAIDKLYSMASTSKFQRVTLPTATTIDVKNYTSDYAKLTNNNFSFTYTVTNSLWYNVDGHEESYNNSSTVTPSLSYNPSTGILTISNANGYFSYLGGNLDAGGNYINAEIRLTLTGVYMYL